MSPYQSEIIDHLRFAHIYYEIDLIFFRNLDPILFPGPYKAEIGGRISIYGGSQ